MVKALLKSTLFFSYTMKEHEKREKIKQQANLIHPSMFGKNGFGFRLLTY